MARIVRLKAMDSPRHLFWRGDRNKFVTLCEDGNVILDGSVMTLARATEILLKEKGVPPSFFWEC